jgi:hypothetical protein
MDSISIPFDPRPFLDALDPGRRRLLFLDQSYWLDLVRPPSSEWRALRTSLENEVEGGRLLVPVTHANLLEAAKLRDGSQLAAVASLMNSLSRNVVFVDTRIRLRREIKYFLRNSRSGVAVSQRRWQHALSIWPAFGGDLSLESHPSPEGRAVAEAIAPAAFDQLAREGIRLVESHMGGYSEWLKASDVMYEARMADLKARIGKGERPLQRQVELEAANLLEHSGFSPFELAKEIGHETMARFAAAHSTPEAKRAAYLAACPTLYASAHVLAAYLEHDKEYGRSDFFDVENLIVAVPYAHLVTFDGHATHIARNRLHLHERFGCRFLSGPSDVLQAICGPDNPEA